MIDCLRNQRVAQKPRPAVGSSDPPSANRTITARGRGPRDETIQRELIQFSTMTANRHVRLHWFLSVDSLQKIGNGAVRTAKLIPPECLAQWRVGPTLKRGIPCAGFTPLGTRNV